MTSGLKDRRILVVEDEYLIADDLREALVGAGAEVLGPYPTIAEALDCAQGDCAVDAAILDVNLRGEMVFPVADALSERGVPFVFATGYDSWTIPERFADTRRLEKPMKAHTVTAVLAPLLGAVVQ